MAANRPPACRDVVQFTWKDKTRVGVVILVDSIKKVATVAYGTRTYRAKLCVKVLENTPYATMIGLHSSTYFYCENILHVQYEMLRVQSSMRCPCEVYFELEKLLQTALLSHSAPPGLSLKIQPVRETDSALCANLGIADATPGD